MLILAILLCAVEIIFLLYASQALSLIRTTLLMNQEKAIIIDLRPIETFRKAHLPHAQHTHQNDFNDLLGKISKEKAIIFVVPQEKPNFNTLWTFRRAGFKKLHHLEGGIAAWQDANLPLFHTEEIKN